MPTKLCSRGFACLLALLWALLATAGTEAKAQDTFFLHSESSFSNQGAWWTQQFTIYQTTSFIMRVAADYKVDAAIIAPAQLSNFQNNRSYVGYGAFSSTFGSKAITLGAGTYYAAIRNRNNGSNQYDFELDKKLFVAADTNATYTYYNSPISGAKYVSKNGGKLWHGFNVVSQYRYFIDGGNSGLNTYFIPESQLANFKANRQFSYYSDYSGQGDASLPGYTELNLSPGTYYLAFHNPAPINKAVTYNMETWKALPRSNGSGNSSSSLNISGSASWQTSGSKVNINVDKVNNTRGAGSKSGSLRLRLWAVRSMYTGGSISGYVFGTRTLKPLSGGYYYYGITGSVAFTRSPAGSYYTTLTLEEYTTSGWLIVDYLNFNGTVRF